MSLALHPHAEIYTTDYTNTHVMSLVVTQQQNWKLLIVPRYTTLLAICEIADCGMQMIKVNEYPYII